MTTLRGYHFVGEALRDGRPVPEDGVWLKHEGLVVPCESGLHMSEHPFDALGYAPGETLCLVELRGDLKPHGDPIDKWVGRERCILKRIDATQLLRRFAADRALSVKHLWDMPPIVEQYLTTLDERLREAAKNATRIGSWKTERMEWGGSAAAWDAASTAILGTECVGAAWDAAYYAARALLEMTRQTARAEFRRRVEEVLTD